MDFKLLSRLFQLLLIPSLLAQAQDLTITKSDSVYLMPDIVISAYRYESSLLSTASSVTIIDSRDIKNSSKISMLDILRNEYGLSFVQQGGPGKLATINMRGGSASHTLILFDGVEMNMPSDPGTVYDFANLPLTNIERIEILRGPQSTLYGSDAMAGVINIITSTPATGVKYFLNGEAGKYNTYSASAGVSGVFRNLDYSLAVSGMRTDGFSSAAEKYGNFENDGADNKIASLKLGFLLNENIRLNLITRFTNASADYDQFGGYFGDDPTYKFNLEELITRPELTLSFGAWEQTLGVSYYRVLRKYSFDSTMAYDAFSNSAYDGKKYKVDWLNNYTLNKRNKFTFGIDAEKENAVSSYREFNYSRSFESNFPQNEMNTVGAFLQYSTEAVDNLFLSGGARNDWHNRFGSIITFRLAPVYFIKSTGTKIKATYGTGFKTPSLFNLYDPTFGNDKLNPEEVKGWDLGIEQFFMKDNFSFGITYFNNVYENLFGYDENFRTININEAETKGTELFYSYHSSEYLTLKFHYTYTKSSDKNPLLDKSERRLLRRPEHKAGISFTYMITEKSRANAEFLYFGTRKDKNFSVFPAETINLSPYAILNLSGSYKIFNYLELYTRLENVLNEKYEEIYGYGVPGFSVNGGFRLIL